MPSRAERVTTGALIGTGIGVVGAILEKSVGIHNAYVNPIEDFLYLPTRFALLGTAFGLGRADFDKNGRAHDYIKPFLVAGALGFALDVGETVMDKVIYSNYPADATSLLLAASTGTITGVSGGYNYLYGRRSMFR